MNHPRTYSQDPAGQTHHPKPEHEPNDTSGEARNLVNLSQSVTLAPSLGSLPQVQDPLSSAFPPHFPPLVDPPVRGEAQGKYRRQDRSSTQMRSLGASLTPWRSRN